MSELIKVGGGTPLNQTGGAYYDANIEDAKIEDAKNLLSELKVKTGGEGTGRDIKWRMIPHRGARGVWVELGKVMYSLQSGVTSDEQIPIAPVEFSMDTGNILKYSPEQKRIRGTNSLPIYSCNPKYAGNGEGWVADQKATRQRIMHIILSMEAAVECDNILVVEDVIRTANLARCDNEVPYVDGSQTTVIPAAWASFHHYPRFSEKFNPLLVKRNKMIIDLKAPSVETTFQGLLLTIKDSTIQDKELLEKLNIALMIRLPMIIAGNDNGFEAYSATQAEGVAFLFKYLLYPIKWWRILEEKYGAGAKEYLLLNDNAHIQSIGSNQLHLDWALLEYDREYYINQRGGGGETAKKKMNSKWTF